MAHMTHRQRQAAAKAEKAAQIQTDARRIEWENRVYDTDREMHHARSSTDAANQSGLSALSTFWYTLIFIGGAIWFLQDDPNPNLIHCIGSYYQPITTTNINDCRR